MSKFAFSGMAAALIGGTMLMAGTAPLSAATMPSPGVAAPGETAVIEQVARRDRDRRSYDWRRHGSRYSYARPGFRHHYGGFYYSSPWWIGPSIGFALTVPSYGGGGHVQWCLNRFRSYDPASDTYLGYDGYRHRCNSPFH